jgi:hypothetical protein
MAALQAKATQITEETLDIHIETDSGTDEVHIDVAGEDVAFFFGDTEYADDKLVGTEQATKNASLWMCARRFPFAKVAEALGNLNKQITCSVSDCETCSMLQQAEAERDQLRAEVEKLNWQLAGCSTLAMANTPESAAECRNYNKDWDCATMHDVADAVDREIKLRAELAAAKAEVERLKKIEIEMLTYKETLLVIDASETCEANECGGCEDDTAPLCRELLDGIVNKYRRMERDLDDYEQGKEPRHD